jgi:S1-C subfamily serine protease
MAEPQQRPPEFHRRTAPSWLTDALDRRGESSAQLGARADRPSGTSPQPPRRPAPARSRSLGALVIAAAVALVASGALAGWLLGAGRESAASGVAAPRTGEPVSAVADRLLPSVVQLEADRSLGSGVVYDASGLILTAAHVVEGARTVTIVRADGGRVPGRVLGADRSTDVAVVRASRGTFTPSALAVGVPVQVGQLAVAIGSPFGLESSVTAGVVSAVERSVPTPEGVMSMIQTDAPINPGNSGGALADRAGRVIGINDAIESGSGVNAGVGFAIPIDVATTVADALVAGRAPSIGHLGVEGTTASVGRPGALVTSVEPGSPADRSGILGGDVITSYDGHGVSGMLDLIAKVRATAPGTRVTLDVVRDGRTLTIDVRIDKQ